MAMQLYQAHSNINEEQETITSQVECVLAG